jgi:GNAT superfamily N-acetyltransferase
MEDTHSPGLTLESKPNPTDIRLLEERIYEFNVQATGISDGERFGIFLRGTDGVVIGGTDGWMWGGTCYIRNLFVPALMRKHGNGTRLMDRIEEEAKARPSRFRWHSTPSAAGRGRCSAIITSTAWRASASTPG